MSSSISKKKISSFLLLIGLLLGINVAFGQDSKKEEWNTLYQKGAQQFKAKNYQEAYTQLDKAYRFAKRELDSVGIEIANSKYQLGKTCIKLGKIDVGFMHLTTSLSLYNKTENNKQKVVLRYFYVARTMAGLNKNDNAINIYYETLGITKEHLTATHFLYPLILKFLSKVYYKIGEYDISISKSKEAIDALHSIEKLDKMSLAMNLTDMAQSYLALDILPKAKKAQQESLKLYDSVSRTSADYAGGLNTLGMIYFVDNEYQKALPYYIQAKKILEHDKSSDYYSVLNNLGQLYDRLGDYEKSLSYTIEALENTDKSDPQYGNRLQNNAFSFVKLGQFEKAHENYNQALEIFENKLTKDHPLYGKLLNNIGKLYFQQGNYQEALPLFDKGLAIFLKGKDENSLDYGYLLDDYATTLLSMDKFERAIVLMEKNVEIGEKNSRTDWESHNNRQYSLAKAYNLVGRYEEALELLENASINFKEMLGEAHPSYGKAIHEMGLANMGIGKITQAITNIESANNNTINRVEDIFKFSSENDKKAFVNIMTDDFEKLQWIGLKQLRNSTKIHEINLNNQLMLKGLLLNNSKDILGSLSGLNQQNLDEKVLQYRQSKNNLIRITAQQPGLRKFDKDSLANEVNIQESDLVKIYSEYFQDNNELSKNWKDSQDKLKGKEIVIEFSHFKAKSFDQHNDSVMYVAYVYNKASETPTMVPLFEEKQLVKLLSKKNPNQLYALRGASGRSTQINGIYNLIWKPLEGYLDAQMTVYFSPSGLLNQIPFAAIGKKGKKSLSQKYELVQLSSSAILANGLHEPSMDLTVLMGGIEFDYTPNKPKVDTNLPSNMFQDNPIFKGIAATRSRGELWGELPGTLKEIDSLAGLLNIAEKQNRILSGKNASEEAFKKINNLNPSILHIATHGFFYENLRQNEDILLGTNEGSRYRLAEDPLLRSGIILAGGNYAWKNGHNPYELENGILTALEISNIDLSKTDIVVLSACETGLGDINGSEGVYGLQRAFKMAGVDIIVMSLWQVPDEETAEFMYLFYKEWLSLKDVRKAFNHTQKIMQIKYKKEPLKWAAFVLIE